MGNTTFPGFTFDAPKNFRDASLYAIAANVPSPTTGFARNITFTSGPLTMSVRETIAAVDAYIIKLRMPGLRLGPRGERTISGFPGFAAEYSHELSGPNGPYRVAVLQLWVFHAKRVLNVTFSDNADDFAANAAERDATIASLQLL